MFLDVTGFGTERLFDFGSAQFVPEATYSRGIMTEPLNILVIEDCNADFLIFVRHLAQQGLPANCSRVDDLPGLQNALQDADWDLMVADDRALKLNFPLQLSLLQAQLPEVPLILLTESLDEAGSGELLKRGAWDFVLKDNLARMVPAIERCLAEVKWRCVRRTDEASLRQSEELYHSLFDNMLNCFAHCRILLEGDTPVDYLYLNVNDAFEKQTGLQNVVGRKGTEVIPGIHESDPELFERFCRVALGGKPERFEIYLESLKNWFSISLYSPEREHFITVFDVISERKQAEQALHDSEERLSLALRGANDGLWDWNLKTNQLFFSPRWKSMLGYAGDELEDCYDSWERLLHPEDKEITLAKLQRFLAGEIPLYELEFRMLHKDGHHVDILSRAFLLYGAGGEQLRLVGTHVDITERNKLEAQYRQAQKMEAIGQLAGGVAHDFNNILSAIFGYSHLILEQVQENDTVKNYLEEIVSASRRAADLTKGLLTFSRKQAVSLAVLDVGEIIRKIEPFLTRLIREDIELAVNCAAEPLLITADRGQIEQVIMNLVANARDAMPDGGRLFIETRAVTLEPEFIASHGYGKEGDYALFSVSDSGLGMDQDTLSRVFEPFFTTKEQGKGTGLGLSMAYGIIKKHDGFINVYSEPGEGTSFTVYLPRGGKVAQPAATAPAKPDAPVGGTETILLGEDDPALRRLSIRVLSHYGYRIIEAVDGQDAIDKFKEHGDSIQLVILDAIMPKKNGREACLEMRKLRPGLKTVFVSGYARDIFAQDQALDEATIFIQKPVAPNELLAKVRALLIS